MNAETPRRRDRRGRNAFLFLLRVFLGVSALAGCQTNVQPPERVVGSTRDAAVRAAQYCHDHNLFWGQPVYIIQQFDGYYVEFVIQNGYKQETHGLTVAYDGSIHAADE